MIEIEKEKQTKSNPFGSWTGTNYFSFLFYFYSIFHYVDTDKEMDGIKKVLPAIRVFQDGGGDGAPPPTKPEFFFVILETNHVMIFSCGPMDRGDKGEHFKPLYRW